MQNKYLHWFNLAAYLPAVLLHFLVLTPLLTAPGSELAAMNACACGCTPAAGARCCCNCAPGESGGETPGIDETVFADEAPGEGKKHAISSTGCIPGQEGWVLPAPVQDHLESSKSLLSTALQPSCRQEETYQPPGGTPPENPDKVPI